MSLLLATALVVTPAATLVPIGGNTVVQAASVATVDTFVDSIVAVYDEMDSEHTSTINSLKSKLAGVNWSVVLGSELEAKINPEIAKKVAEIVYTTNKNELKTVVNNFRTEHSADFQAIFGGKVTVDDFLDFFVAFEAHLKGKNISDLISDFSKANFNYSTFMKNNIQEVVAKDAKYLTLQNEIKASTGLTFSDLFDMKSRLDSQVGLTDTQRTELRAAFVNAVTKAYLADPGEGVIPPAVPGGGGGGGAAPAPTPTPETPTVPERPGQLIDATNTTTVEREQTTTGQTKAVTIVNGGSLASVVAANPNADRIGFTLERAEGEVAELRLPKAAVEALLGATNTNLVVDIDSADGSVSIPVSELAEEKLRAALGLSGDADFEVSISISQASAAVAAVVTERLAADARNLQARSAVIDFSMTVRSGDREVAITNFDSYIFREIPVSGLVNVDNAVAYNVDAEPVAVPTQVGTERVRFASLAFSKYVVVERQPVTFSDLTNTHWAKKSIDRLTIRDVIVGFADGEVKPKRVTTRAEFAAMLTRSLALPEAGNYNGRFSDVKGNEWYVKSLIPAVEAGLLEGRANGTFGANDPITRQEAAAVVSRALSFLNVSDDALDAGKSVGSFTDVASIAPWAEADVKRAVQAGIIEGHANGTFEARGATQRGQVAAMIERLLKKGSLL